jgi:hypothetical protein
MEVGMRETSQRRIAVLLCLAVGALIAAFVGLDRNSPTPASGTDDPAQSSSARSGSTSTPGAADRAITAETAGLRSAPGAASARPADEQMLSTRLAGLGLAPQAVPAAGATLGPPPWVKAGTRLTFYSAAASVAQSRFAWVEDPEGTWEDPVTGTRYRRTDESGEGVTTASGDGFAQIDVLAVDGTDVVLSLNLYGIDRSTNTFIPGLSTGAKAAGAEIDGTWINPARLAELQEVRANGLLVLRGRYPLNGTTYDAISFALTTPGAYQQYTYDTSSGVLLSATSRTDSPPSPVTSPTEAPPQGNQQLTVTFFAGIRQRTMPGAGGANPEWVARSPRLDYTGAYHWTNPVDPSSGAFNSSMAMAVSLRSGGATWASYTAHTTVPELGSASDGSGVTGPTGLYWLSR